MAGEMAFFGFDLARYEEIAPRIGELRTTRALSKACLALLSSMVRGRPSSRAGSGRAALGRIVRHPDLAPRYFLTPRELGEAIEFVVVRRCFESETPFALDNARSDTGVVLEHSLSTLFDVPSFYALATGRWDVIRPESPRGEASLSVLPRAQLMTLEDALRAGLRKTPKDAPWSRREIELLLALRERIASRQGWTLAFRALL